MLLDVSHNYEIGSNIETVSDVIFYACLRTFKKVLVRRSDIKPVLDVDKPLASPTFRRDDLYKYDSVLWVQSSWWMLIMNRLWRRKSPDGTSVLSLT